MQYTKLFTVLYFSTVLYSGTGLHVVHYTDRNSGGGVGACGYVGSGYFLQRTRSVRRGVEFVVPCLPDTEPATPPRGIYTADRTPDAVMGGIDASLAASSPLLLHLEAGIGLGT